MSDNKTLENDEIDLIELFKSLWEGRWLIGAFTSLALIIGTVSASLISPSFVAITQIKPITKLEAQNYRDLKSFLYTESMLMHKHLEYSDRFSSFDVSPEMLRERFIDQLDRRDLLIEVFLENEFLNEAAFENVTDFRRASLKLADEVSLNAPDKKKNAIRKHWTIEFKHTDEDVWRGVLRDIFSKANARVRQELKEEFERKIEMAREQKNFRLEDTELLISNAEQDHETRISFRLVFLGEQAAIARQLGLSKGVAHQLYTQELYTQALTNIVRNGVIASSRPKSILYLRGYEAIEKEIDLIKSRKNKKAFMDDLPALEQKKRSLQQNKTIMRIESLFALTPIATNDDFRAVDMRIESTDFKYKDLRVGILAVSVMMGGMIGAITVLVRGFVRKRKEASA